MPKRPPPLKGEDLRKFRHKVSQLKKWGVVSRIDARGAKPSQVRQGRNLSDWIDRYDDELSGKATPIPVSKFSKSQLKQLRKQYEIKDKKFLIQPHAATEKVGPVRKGKIEIQERRHGIRRVSIPVPYHDLSQYLHDIDKQSKELDKLKGPRGRWGYKIFGNYSWNNYASLDQMMKDLIHGSVSGKTLEGKWDRLSKSQQKKVFGQLVFTSFPRKSDWPKHKNVETKPKSKKKKAKKSTKRKSK